MSMMYVRSWSQALGMLTAAVTHVTVATLPSSRRSRT